MTTDRIDMVIPFHEKDLDTLKKSLRYLEKNIVSLRHIYIVGAKDPGLANCRFIREDIFSFRQIIGYYYDLYVYRHGWIFQQLIKLLAWRFIDDLSELYLVWDSDTVPYRPLEFVDQTTGQHILGKSHDIHPPYFDHIYKVCPQLEGRRLEFSGICHHQLLSQYHLKKLVNMVEITHKGMPFELVFLSFLDRNEKACCSEYELYATFMHVFYPDQIQFRTLKMLETSTNNNFGHAFDIDYPF
jgi:hypothetical protein